MRQLIRNMSGLGIAYPDSPLTVPADGPGRGPRPGERLTQISAADAQSPGWVALRARLREPGWHLLAFAGGERTGSPAWLNEVRITRGQPDADEVRDADGRVHDTLGATGGDWILVRPDGYLSARGAGAAGLHDALDRLPGLRPRAEVAATA
jgi:6-methylpretetramide 4-monooxygenase / 4-hydroxy-6-methylpretetramide 12a-monooxygenase